MNIATPSEIYEKGINPYAITLYNVLYLLSSKSEKRATDIKNPQLAEYLKWEIKTVSKYVKQLKDLNLIIITGSTRNRIIRCNHPSQMLKNISLEKEINSKPNSTPLKVEIAIEELRAQKLFIEYKAETSSKEQNDDLKHYLDDSPKGLAYIDKLLLREKGDISIAKTFNCLDFMNFIARQRTEVEKKRKTAKRAEEYDKQHKKTFTAELNDFYKFHSNVTAFEAFKYRKYQKLSDCPYELQKLFLNWLEPELF